LIFKRSLLQGPCCTRMCKSKRFAWSIIELLAQQIYFAPAPSSPLSAARESHSHGLQRLATSVGLFACRRTFKTNSVEP